MQRFTNGYNDLAYIYQNVFQDMDVQKYEKRAETIKNSIEKNLWNSSKTTVPEFQLYDYAYHNSSYNGVLIDKEYYPHVLAQIYVVLYGLVDANSERGEQIWFLHTKFSEPRWYVYEDEKKYPHMENLVAALMYDKDKIKVNGEEINIGYAIRMAISKVLYWEAKKVKDYTWNCQEAGNTIIAINMYINKNVNAPLILDHMD